MALTMGEIRRLTALAEREGHFQGAAARLASEALLQAVARQAIIGAAADAVAGLGRRSPLDLDFPFPKPVTTSTTSTTSGNPGGPVDDGNPDDDDRKKQGGTWP